MAFELYNCATSYNDITVTVLQASRHLVYVLVGRQTQSNYFWLYYELLSIAAEASTAERISGRRKEIHQRDACTWARLPRSFCQLYRPEVPSLIDILSVGDYGKKEPKSCPAQAIQRSCVPEIVPPHCDPSGDWLDFGFLRHCNFRCVRLLFSCCPTEKPHDRDLSENGRSIALSPAKNKIHLYLTFFNCNFETLVCDSLRWLSLTSTPS